MRMLYTIEELGYEPEKEPVAYLMLPGDTKEPLYEAEDRE